MIKVSLEAQGQVVLGNLKIMGDSESQGTQLTHMRQGPGNEGRVGQVKGRTGRVWDGVSESLVDPTVRHIRSWACAS